MTFGRGNEVNRALCQVWIVVNFLSFIKPKGLYYRYTSKVVAMRYFYFLILAVFVTSCAHNRLRLVKVPKKDRTENVAQLEAEKKSTRKSDQERELVVVKEEEKATKAILESPKKELESETKTASGKALKVVEKQEERTDTEFSDQIEEEDEPSKQYKLQQALAAERDARKAKNSFIWSIAMLFCFFLPFVPLFSLIPFIIGSIRLMESSRNGYITPEGERDEKAARIMQIIYGAVVIAFIILILALFYLL